MKQDGQHGMKTVAQVAAVTGVTARTLHHYDRLGLLVPSGRSEAGYRLYAPADLARLREVLVWRRLGLPLAEIGRLLDDPQADRGEVLRHQRALVAQQLVELRQLAAALDLAIDGDRAGVDAGAGDGDGRGDRGDRRRLEREDVAMSADEQIIKALDGFDPRDYEAEAAERWGDTDAYRESAKRTKQYGPADWQKIKAEGDDINRRLAQLWELGASAEGEDAIALAEEWRAHISRWFYECSPGMLGGLGEMYVADPRFTASYDGPGGERAGFACWVRDAWVARADQG